MKELDRIKSYKNESSDNSIEVCWDENPLQEKISECNTYPV